MKLIMKADVRTKWLAALRSGEYTQTKSYLRTGGSYCCLGVLCDLAVKDGAAEWRNHDGQPFHFIAPKGAVEGEVENTSGSALINAVLKWSGLGDIEGDAVTRDHLVPIGAFPTPLGMREKTLTDLNDHMNWNFQQIANVIEERIEPV